MPGALELREMVGSYSRASKARCGSAVNTVAGTTWAARNSAVEYGSVAP